MEREDLKTARSAPGTPCTAGKRCNDNRRVPRHSSLPLNFHPSARAIAITEKPPRSIILKFNLFAITYWVSVMASSSCLDVGSVAVCRGNVCVVLSLFVLSLLSLSLKDEVKSVLWSSGRQNQHAAARTIYKKARKGQRGGEVNLFSGTETKNNCHLWRWFKTGDRLYNSGQAYKSNCRLEQQF